MEIKFETLPFQVWAVRPTLTHVGGIKGSHYYMDVLGPNKVCLCLYKVTGISRGLSVIIKTKNFHPIFKIDRIIDIFFGENIFKKKIIVFL